jgi:hypothetical protein
MFALVVRGLNWWGPPRSLSWGQSSEGGCERTSSAEDRAVCQATALKNRPAKIQPETASIPTIFSDLAEALNA